MAQEGFRYKAELGSILLTNTCNPLYFQISHPSMSGLKIGDKGKFQVERCISLARRPLVPLPESNMSEQQQARASRQQNG